MDMTKDDTLNTLATEFKNNVSTHERFTQILDRNFDLRRGLRNIVRDDVC